MESKDIYELLEIFPSKAPSLCHREDHTSEQYDSGLSKCHHRSHETPVKQCCAANGKWISDVVEDVGNVLFPFHPLPERKKCPHPLQRVLLCSLPEPLPRPYIFDEPGNGYLEGYWWSSCAGALLGLNSSPGEGKCQIIDVTNTSSF